MAVKVIDDKPDASVVKRVVCQKCGVTLEYLPQDVRKTTHTDYSGDTDEYFWVDCPNCKHANSVGRPKA
jgi:hypothetical protein